jgi:hypothetical protein
MKYVDHYVDADDAARVSLEEQPGTAEEFEAQIEKTLWRKQDAVHEALMETL